MYALRAVVLSWFPWAAVDDVALASPEGTWPLVVKATVRVTGYAEVEKGALVLPGFAAVHRIGAAPTTLGHLYAGLLVAARPTLSIASAVRYALHRRVRPSARTKLARGPVDVTIANTRLRAKREAKLDGGALDEASSLDVTTGNVGSGEVRALRGGRSPHGRGLRGERARARGREVTRRPSPPSRRRAAAPIVVLRRRFLLLHAAILVACGAPPTAVVAPSKPSAEIARDAAPKPLGRTTRPCAAGDDAACAAARKEHVRARARRSRPVRPAERSLGERRRRERVLDAVGSPGAPRGDGAACVVLSRVLDARLAPQASDDAARALTAAERACAAHVAEGCADAARLRFRRTKRDSKALAASDAELARAIEELDHACEAGEPVACDALGDTLTSAKSPAKPEPARAVEAYRRALPGLERRCDDGDPFACLRLGRTLAWGGAGMVHAAEGASAVARAATAASRPAAASSASSTSAAAA